MTMPHERTRSIIFARELLEELRDSELHPETTNETRRCIAVVLRHFPRSFEIDSAARRAPDLFCKVAEFATEPVVEAIRESLFGLSIDLAYIFGGDDPAEGIDLLVVSDTERGEITQRIGTLGEEMGRSFHLFNYSRAEWQEALADPVNASITSQPKIMVIGEDPAAH
jgi:hypothetical protein